MLNSAWFRRLLLAGVVTFLVLTATPAQAIQYQDSCYKCRWTYNMWDYSYAAYCGDPDRNTWGYTKCVVNWANNCWTEGDMCYYIEVSAR